MTSRLGASTLIGAALFISACAPEADATKYTRTLVEYRAAGTANGDCQNREELAKREPLSKDEIYPCTLKKWEGK